MTNRLKFPLDRPVQSEQSAGLHWPGPTVITTYGGTVTEDDIHVRSPLPDDKSILAHLLQLAVKDATARGKDINFDSNEELPRFVPILCHNFSREELVGLIGEKVTSQIIDLHRTTILQNLFLEAGLKAVLRALNEAGIPLLLFKGAALAYSIYPDASLRTYHDFDVLVHPTDLQRADMVLTSLGYGSYDEYRIDAVDMQRTGYNYMLKQPGLPFAVQLELHTALHASEIGTRFDLVSLWSNAISIKVLGESIETMHPVDYLLYLCWHYRFHGFTRLMWLYDLVMLLRTYGDELDWSALVSQASGQQMQTTLYYCLSWCRQLFGVAIPAHVFTRLCPPILTRLIVERVAMPDPAKSLAAASAHDRRLLARRAMVDSHGKLFQALLRTLFPSPLAIAKRYMNHSRLPLQVYFLFYLIHPWVALAKGCRYLLKNRKYKKD